MTRAPTLIAIFSTLMLLCGGNGADAIEPERDLRPPVSTPQIVPLVPPAGAPFSDELPVEPEGGDDAARDEEAPATAVDRASLPPIQRDLATLPAPVRATREALVAAAKTGEPNALRPIIERTSPPPVLSSIEGGDPIDVIMAQSGDNAGREILAIMLDVLDAGWVHVGAGTSQERYVWPWFAAYPPGAITGPEMVEVYRLLTAGDFEEMQTADAYVFFRVEIAPDGRWIAFVSGD